MNSIKYFIVFLLGFFFFSCHSQSLISYQNIFFQTGEVNYENNDTITYVFSKSEFSIEKPNLFFLQGSLPRPIIFDVNDSTSVITPISNFSVKNLVKNIMYLLSLVLLHP